MYRVFGWFLLHSYFIRSFFARSACKGCSAAIAKGALRLGAHARDPRAGYDTTKWYHVACFPASSHPLGPLDKVPGFLWIKVWCFFSLLAGFVPLRYFVLFCCFSLLAR
jgi:hypothetical protein